MRGLVYSGAECCASRDAPLSLVTALCAHGGFSLSGVDCFASLVTNSRKMSNNPFASAMNGEYVHHRDPPPPPPSLTTVNRPVSREKKPDAPAPPSYEEAAGPDAAAREYPQEKPPTAVSLSQSRHSRPHRSQSDSARHRSQGERRHHKSSRNKSPSKKKVAPHNSKNLDTIDKLDVSAFYGGRFHHDGPFDACTPHRNKNEKNAPVMAFPADGPNTLMKPFGPGVNNHERMNLAFGNYSEDQNEIVGRVGAGRGSVPPVPKTNRTSADPQSAYTPRLNPSVVAFDANQKAAPIHGLTTAGLGSSTFLDGAPAPRADEYLSPNTTSGLGRKKSLVQRLRKNSLSEANSRRSSNDNSAEYPRVTSGDDEEGGASSLLRRVKSLKVGRK